MTMMTELKEWQALKAHQNKIADQSMLDWFAADNQRFQRFSLQFEDFKLDFSKNRITYETLGLLIDLANAADLPNKIIGLFNGSMVNSTEQRPALHTALRQHSNPPLHVQGQNIIPEIKSTLEKMRHFCEQVRTQAWLGVTGKPIRDIINIGIGGSHLGPLMATCALQEFAMDDLSCHFISNIDSVHLNEVLTQIEPESSLFIISSKSFTTLETLTNAQAIRQWLQQQLQRQDVHSHFVAVTAATNKALAFGIPADQIFPIWDWVGGRYSVWSAIGLPIALMIGMDAFLEFLKGGHAMDMHFRQTEFSKNIPVIMALLGIWYINFFDAHNHAVIPYAQRLKYFHAHLQQLDMESNGKCMSHEGHVVNYATGPVIFGEHGCNGQHAFHQLFHQGPNLIPIDFILTGSTHSDWQQHHDILIASGLSQAQALLRGKTFQEALAEVHAQGYSGTHAETLAMHKTIPGNRPSNTLFFKKITPYYLGVLLALYEHKIFVQGAIWNINSFDQWGVELGKQLLPAILADMQDPVLNPQLDASTAGLIAYYKNREKIL